ncbi:MAG: hypothetical protein CM1200mP39_27450 [Dehalococcoidia bacterium]|nr:MAG: hypothetical protein CM1200mP39_27450 [Dehalococcoidia bacterium]
MPALEQFEIFDDGFQKAIGPNPKLNLLVDGLAFAKEFAGYQIKIK